jgi:hypothetical protein
LATSGVERRFSHPSVYRRKRLYPIAQNSRNIRFAARRAIGRFIFLIINIGKRHAEIPIELFVGKPDGLSIKFV